MQWAYQAARAAVVGRSSARVTSHRVADLQAMQKHQQFRVYVHDALVMFWQAFGMPYFTHVLKVF